MAVRTIVKLGDPVLEKKSRPVDEITPKIRELLDDMVETMDSANGVGLAAPQVGVLRRLIVIRDEDRFLRLINPEVTSKKGMELGVEGCLSVPGVYGEVERPARVTVKATTPDGKPITINADGFLARILCHEIDHLNGEIFTKKAKSFIDKD